MVGVWEGGEMISMVGCRRCWRRELTLGKVLLVGVELVGGELTSFESQE
jgi:hypothetical protein